MAFTGKIYFCIFGLGLGLGSVALALHVSGLGLGFGLDLVALALTPLALLTSLEVLDISSIVIVTIRYDTIRCIYVRSKADEMDILV